VASITKFPGNRKRIQFIGADGRRRAVWLGKAAQLTADTVKMRIEFIVSAREAHAPLDKETARWVDALGGRFRKKLAAVGLCAVKSEGPKVSGTDPYSLGGMLAAFNEARLKIKPGTRITWQQSQSNLLTFFGSGKRITDITEADADQWCEWLAVKKAEKKKKAGAPDRKTWEAEKAKAAGQGQQTRRRTRERSPK
jgi:hypothetical protein